MNRRPQRNNKVVVGDMDDESITLSGPLGFLVAVPILGVTLLWVASVFLIIAFWFICIVIGLLFPIALVVWIIVKVIT